MNDNKGMILYKESFISKIKKFFKNLFSNKNQEKQIVQKTHEEKEQKAILDEAENKFLKEIKVETNFIDSEAKKKSFLEEIDGNIEALNMLSIDRLKKLEEYYDAEIKRNIEKINKLKTA